MITVKNLNELNSLPNHEDGEFAFIEDTKEVYKYTDDSWIPTEKSKNIEISTYQLNKTAASGLKKLTKKAIEELKNTIAEFTKDSYYMLLCRDLNYYTIFHMGAGTESISDAVIECLHDLGSIKAGNVTDDGAAIEFWVTNSKKESVAVYYFNYTQGVVECL